MPSRVSARPPRLSTKTSAQGLSSGASTHARPSTATTVPEERPVSSLQTQICTLFGESQRTTAGHRKLIVTLRKIQERCVYEPQEADGKASGGVTENDFNEEVMRCILRILVVKKSEGAADKVVKFLGHFLAHANDKDMSLFPAEELEQAEAFPETPTSRLVTHILSTLHPLLSAKEKAVRFRATQIMSQIINSLDSIDDECYQLVKTGLLKRIRDKESMVRVQAVLGLGRLAGNEAGDENEDDMSDGESGGLLEKLLDVLQNDPSADVRRSLLLNLPLTPATLPYLLERARDLDGATRRALYARLLPALGDFRHLSLSMREKLLRWGLRDRDETVRKATARLFRERWIGDCAGTNKEGTGEQERSAVNVDSLLELLERIDVVNSGVETGIAHEAMHEFWDGRPDYLNQIALEQKFWDKLTAEKAFIARSLNDYCRQPTLSNRYDSVLDEKLPEVTRLAFYIQRYTNALIAQLQLLDIRQQTEPQEATVELEFVIEQLLHIALTVDYSDEMGRRQMFALLREMLALPELPEEITKLMIETLRLICGPDQAGEREFCGVVLEAVAEVHDTIAPEMLPPPDNDDTTTVDLDDSFHSARSAQTADTTPTKKNPGSRKLLAGDDSDTEQEEDEDKALREILVNLKCLHIAQCMLQNVHCELQPNVHLLSMLNNLVVPAVRSHEAPVRERGLLCLGLCCLLDRTLAEENLTLFLHCFSKGHPALQTTALEILSDMLTTHPALISGAADDADAGAGEQRAALRKQLLRAFAKGLKLAHEPTVQAAAVQALCKLMLTRVLVDADLLRSLVVLFFEPAAAGGGNAAVRQALSYFLPTYAHSRAANQAVLAQVVPAAVHAVLALGEADDQDAEASEERVTGATLAGLLADWTDPRKVVRLDDAVTGWVPEGEQKKDDVLGDVHLIVAEGCLERALAANCPKEERKVLLSVVAKLYVTSHSSAENLLAVNELAAEALDAKVASDAATRNGLTKFVAALAKASAAAQASRRGASASVDRDLTPKASRSQLGGTDAADSSVLDASAIEGESELTVRLRDVGDDTIGPDTADTTAVLADESVAPSDDSLADESGEDITAVLVGKSVTPGAESVAPGDDSMLDESMAPSEDSMIDELGED